MAEWEKIPYGWEETHGKYRFISERQEIKNLPDREFDVIVVMAGGLDDNGWIHPWVRNRLDVAIELYKKKETPIICTGGGTYHKPPALNQERFVIHEATACAEYLINNGVKPESIIKEWGSYDTIASVYFTLLLCISPRNWRRICVITSTFHMPRVELLFNWICGLHHHYHCTFVEAKDDNLDQKVVAQRTLREQKSVENVANLRKSISTKEEFHRWLFTQHKAYSCNFSKQERERIPDSQKLSY